MSSVCGRCREEESVLECADCVGSKRRGDLLPLCEACNALIHVGFLSEHQVVSVTIKQQKKLFEEQLVQFKSQGKNLQLKLNEVNYARQDIEQRSQYNQQVVTQAFQAVWQSLKQKEKELIGPLRDASKREAALLAECEKNVSRATSEFQNLCTDAQKLLQGNSLDFAQQYDGMKKKLEEFEIGRVGTSFPSLGLPARLDVTSLLQNIKDLHLQSDEAPAGDGASKEKVGDEKVSPVGVRGETTPELQSPKEGDTLQVYVESRLDTKGHFWVSRNLSEDIANLYENLSFRIRQDIVQSPLAQLEIEEGMLCCGQFQEDHRWYRGRVEQLKKDKGLARIRWLDYAHDNEVPLAAVQPLKEEFQTLPFQALECCLFEDLDEDLPHQARWEFTDHTANALLNCTILKQMSPPSSDNKGRVYFVELRNPYKEVDIKEAVMEKAEEASSKKDSIACRDIRYMKDYVPPSGKSKSAKKETSSGKSKEREDAKEAKKQNKEDKTADANKGTKGETEGETKVSKDGSERSKGIDATEEMADASQGEIAPTQGGGGDNEMNETRQVDVDGMDDAGNTGDSVTDQEGGEQKTGLSGKGDESGKVEMAGTDSIDAVTPSNLQKDVAGENALTTSIDNASKAAPGTVQILKQEDAVSGQSKSQDRQGRRGQTDKPTGDDVPSGQQGSTESQLPGNSTSCPETLNAHSPPSDQNGRSQDAQPSRGKSDLQRSAAADAGIYSLEPGDEDDEEGADHRLIERLARQGDRAMAHSPDIAFGDRAGANSEGMPYHGAYHPYSSAGYHMAPGMFGGVQRPPEALGLNPIAPSSESCGDGHSVEMSKSDQGSFTGDGFKIVVGSSFSIYVTTPLSDKGCFWASKLRGPAQESQLRRLMHDISFPTESLALDRLKEVKVVCAQTQSGQWCRARVEGVVDDKVQVRYVDFGQADSVEEHRIKTLPVAYQLFPFQAIELSIATRHQTRFSEQAKEAFLRYTQGRILTAKVVAIEPKGVAVSLSCTDENQLTYDISSAVLNINSETMPSNTEERSKERMPMSAENAHGGSRDEQNGGTVGEDHRLSDTQDVRYDHQSEGRSHDRGSGEQCFVCYNYGHISYDCPNKRGDTRDRNDRNYRNKGGSKKNWGRRNRKY